MRNYPTKNYATRRGVYRNCAATLLLLLCCYFSNSQVDYLNLPRSNPQTINGRSNLVIENLQFTNMNGNDLSINNSSNITVRNCYFGVSSGIGVELENCNNITIENCFFANNKSGVYATSCSGIKVNNNQFINAQGPFPRGQFVQFNTVNGAGNSVSGNRGECYRGESYAEDLVNMYRTSGTQGSPVQVKDNYFRGGGPSPSGGGLMSGDFDGGWVVVENNTLVFPGNYGVAMAGGNNIILRNNTVYSERAAWTNVGMYVWAQQGASCSNVTVTGNKVTWTHKDGFNNPFWDGGNCGTINWNCCNTSGQSLASMNVPRVIVNCVTEDELWQVREDSRHFVVNTQVREMPPWLSRPTANAGADKTVNGTTTTLNGGGGNSYRWVQVSGPNNSTIGNATSNNANLSGLVNGTYNFRLEAYDAAGAGDADWITITVTNSQPAPNTPPVANTNANITITLPTNTATLNGSTSTDADGTIESYQWTQVSGPNTATMANADQAVANLSNLIEGTYTFRLTVTDDDNATATKTMTVTVNPAANRPPVADAGVNAIITLPIAVATLDGSNSSDPDGTIESYRWTQVSGPSTAIIATPNQAGSLLSSLIEGVYTFRLTVTDDDNATDAETVNVTVNPLLPTPNQAPVADAGANITITLPVNTATLNGSQSTDADGTIESYQWTQVNGPNTATIANAAQASANLSGLVEGVYTFRLTVRDDDNATASETVNVTVNPAAQTPNQPPVANAGANITITLPVAIATLNGSQSTDADGTIDTYQWTQVSGPNTAAIANGNQATANLSGLAEGVYTFRLTVTDDDNATATETVNVTVNAAAQTPNQLPVANAGANITITLPVNTATLNGSNSSDPDGTIASHQWTQVNGPNTATIANANQATANLSGLVQGVYTFRLTVTDNDNATSSVTVNVTVNAAAPAPNQLPVANAGTNIAITLPVNTAALNGTQSNDPDGTIASYQWTQVSGPGTATITNADQARPTVSALIQGVYTFRLTVRDNDGGTSSDAVNVTVNAAVPAPNQLPVANAGTNIIITLPVNTAALNGSQSTDPDGTIASYQWVQVSGPNTATMANANQARPNLSGLIEGIYTFRLTVRDNDGGTASDAVNVTVNAAAPAPNQLPVANAGANIIITLPVNTTTLNGSQSNDPDGNIASYQWTQVTGPNTATMANANQATSGVSGLVQGTYTFRLTIRDNDGATDADDVVVTVSAAAPPANRPPVANAGPNITITLPTSTATLNGTQSTDPDGTIVSYQWTQVSGPNTATIANANQASAAVSRLVQGRYTFRLTVRDNDGATDFDEMVVAVNAALPPANRPPVAVAGNDLTLTTAVTVATLNGSQSNDPDGTIVSYQWAQLAGGPNTATITNPNLARASISGLAAGTYTFRLTVRDDDGGAAADIVIVKVSEAPNTAPIANAGANIAITLPVNTTTLNGTASTDADGTIASYQWAQASGPNTATIANANQATTGVSGLVQGTYTFRLTIRDNRGATATATVTVTVRPAANKAPIANAGISQQVTLSSNEGTLNGTLSRDPDGVITAYQWVQISGPSNAVIAAPAAATTKISGFSEGDYVFQLTVRDNSNATAKDTVTIAVVNNFRAFTNDLMLYPNPATDQINLILLSDKYSKASVNVYDVTARKVLTPFELTNAQNRFTTVIDIARLKPGAYIIEIIMDNRKKVTAKFVKQ
jgi:parallel beta-helix repeat protein